MRDTEQVLKVSDDLLLKTISMSDEQIQSKLSFLIKKRKFMQCVHFYKMIIDNPNTVNRKLIGLILEFDTVYAKLKPYLNKREDSNKKVEKIKALTARLNSNQKIRSSFNKSYISQLTLNNMK
jgi:hypothetical protein